MHDKEVRRTGQTSETYTHARPTPALPLEMASHSPSLRLAFSRRVMISTPRQVFATRVADGTDAPHSTLDFEIRMRSAQKWQCFMYLRSLSFTARSAEHIVVWYT